MYTKYSLSCTNISQCHPTAA